MKKLAILVFLSLFNFYKASVILGTKNAQTESPKARKLVVYPGYNEIEVTENYKKELQNMISRVKHLHHQLEDFQHNTAKDVEEVIQKLSAQTDKNQLDLVLNEMFIDEQKHIERI